MIQEPLHNIGKPLAVRTLSSEEAQGPEKTYTVAQESTKNSLSDRLSFRVMREAQQISSGTEARGGAELGWAGWTEVSTCRTASFPTQNKVFLQLSVLSPCFLWNQQAPGGVRDLEVGAGVEEHLDKGASPGETYLRPWREDLWMKRRSDSGRVCPLSEPKLEGPRLSHCFATNQQSLHKKSIRVI